MVQATVTKVTNTFPLLEKIVLDLNSKFSGRIRRRLMDKSDPNLWMIELKFQNAAREVFWRAIWFSFNIRNAENVLVESGSFFLDMSAEFVITGMTVIPISCERLSLADLDKHPFNTCLRRLVSDSKGNYKIN